jgi:hypothetical protein
LHFQSYALAQKPLACDGSAQSSLRRIRIRRIGTGIIAFA